MATKTDLFFIAFFFFLLNFLFLKMKMKELLEIMYQEKMINREIWSENTIWRRIWSKTGNVTAASLECIWGSPWCDVENSCDFGNEKALDNPASHAHMTALPHEI